MDTYKVEGRDIDSVELKCLLVSRGVAVDKAVYKAARDTWRLYPNALCCNSFKLPDGTVVQLTDLGFHMSQLKSMFSWDNLKLMKYMGDMTSPFKIVLVDGAPVLTCNGDEVCTVSFMPPSHFYEQKSRSGMPFMNNAVLQGCDWVAFQCLWPCEYAMAGKPCQFCYSGGQFEVLAQKKKPMPYIPTPDDVADVVNYAIDHDGVTSMQLTGGSTFSADKEYEYILSYLKALMSQVGRDKITGEILLYITPPESSEVIDEYFRLGVDRIACSFEVWDDDLAREITPGKRDFTTKERHMKALEYIAQTYGSNKAFTNFIIGLEPVESLEEGARWCAERGIIPTCSVWMPMGKPVRGSMKAPDVDYYRAVKEMMAEIYRTHGIHPVENCGLNVCIERDIKRYIDGE